METYWYEVIKTGQLDAVDLTSIARGRDKSQLLRLIENVMFLILHCPSKETYIARIMNLRQSFQHSLMEFIEKMLAKHNVSGEEGQNLAKRENTRLRQDKLLLTQELDESLRVIVDLTTRVDSLGNEKEELKQQVVDLENVVNSKPSASRASTANSFIAFEYDAIIAEKEATIKDLKNVVNELKISHEAEVQALRDEVDEGQEKLVQMSKASRDIEIYKKRLEEMAGIKKQLKELQEANETLQNKLRTQEDDINDASSSKQMLAYFKEQVALEKERIAQLVLSNDEKERINKDLLRQKKELEEQKAFQEAKVRELRDELDNSRLHQDSARDSDESFTLQRNILADYDDQIKRLEEENKLLRSQSSHDTISKHFNEQMDAAIIARRLAEERLREETAAKSKAVKHLTKVENEFEEYKEDSNNQINYLVLEKDSLNEELESLRNLAVELERAKLKCEKLQTELETLKRDSAVHNAELKQLYREKDEVAQKYLKIKEELHQVQSIIAQKDTEIKSAAREHQLLTIELESIKQKSSGADKIKQLELERDSSRLNSEISGLRLILRDKDDEILRLKVAAQQSLAAESKSEEVSTYTRLISEKENEIKYWKSRSETMKNCWNKEMKLMTMVVHEVGMDINRLSRGLQGPSSRNY